MNAELWLEDIEYLNSKIQKEFTSFVPGIKNEFAKEIEALKKQVPSLLNHEVACEIQRVLATLQDGHTELNVGNNTVGFHRLPLSLYFFERELYVLAAHKEFENLIGAKIIEIENTTLDDAFELLKTNMSRDNKMEYLHAAPGYLILTELLSYLDISSDTQKVTIHVQYPDGKSEKATLTGLDYSSWQKGEWTNFYSVNQIERPLFLFRTGS